MELNVSDLMSWKTALFAGLGSTMALLLAGKAFRRLLFLPIEWIIRKTPTKIDDVLLKEAEKDVGISSVIEEAEQEGKK